MVAELQLHMDTEIYILDNRLKFVSPLKNIMATCFKIIKMFVCISVIYTKEIIQKTQTIGANFHSSVICSKLCKYRCKVSVNVK